jgi:hypothetical protein
VKAAARLRSDYPGRWWCGAAAAALLVLASCGSNRIGPSVQDELGGAERAPDSITFHKESASVYSSDCRSQFSANDVAGFAQECFAAMASLQLTVDANPGRQILADPEGKGFGERETMQACGERVMAQFAASGDAWIRELARPMAKLLADARSAEAIAGEIFRRTDWNATGDATARAKRWSEIRPSTRALSQRGSVLAGSVVAALREDGRMDLGPGALRITSAGRDTALRHRGRLTDLTIMVELGIDPDGPMSKSARMVVKWLYHSNGLRFANP